MRVDADPDPRSLIQGLLPGFTAVEDGDRLVSGWSQELQAGVEVAPDIVGDVSVGGKDGWDAASSLQGARSRGPGRPPAPSC